MRVVEVLVVGAGPAGSSAARVAAEAGARVVFVDAKSEIGEPVRCAEYVPLLMAREVEIPDDAVAQRVDEMVVFEDAEGDGGCTEIGRVRSPGFILHRERLEKALVASAVRAGAAGMLSTRATPGHDGEVELSDDVSVRRIRPTVVVSAEGPFPAFSCEGRRGPCLPAVQFTLPLAQRTSATRIYFSREFRFGYGWVFPKGDVANVGVACAPAAGRDRMLPLLEGFVERLRRGAVLADGSPARRTAGWIPVWGPPKSAVKGNVLFAGDAGGFTDPVTGAGLWPAIATGRLAGESAAEAARTGDTATLPAYDAKWRGLFGRALDRAHEARKTMEMCWDGGEFGKLIRGIWPGL